MLRVITDNKITKISYLNKLFTKAASDVPTIDMKSITNDITEKSCEFLFNKDLKPSLIEFLPRYIKYLAYKIETKGN